MNPPEAWVTFRLGRSWNELMKRWLKTEKLIEISSELIEESSSAHSLLVALF